MIVYLVRNLDNGLFLKSKKKYGKYGKIFATMDNAVKFIEAKIPEESKELHEVVELQLVETGTSLAILTDGNQLNLNMGLWKVPPEMVERIVLDSNHYTVVAELEGGGVLSFTATSSKEWLRLLAAVYHLFERQEE